MYCNQNTVKMFNSKHVISNSITALLLFIISTTVCYSQVFKLDNHKSTLSIFGTSSLHDWEEKASMIKGSIAFKTSEDFQIEKLYIELPSEGLKSGKNAMDKNTYKALKTDQFKTITFQFVKTLELLATSENSFNIKILGDLTVAGITKRNQLDFKLRLKEKELVLNGEFELEMTDYNIEPPKALFGTITTGNHIIIKYNIVMQN